MADLTIQDVRAKYPQYTDMSDTQLADALHAKYYADMDKSQFYAKIGLNQKDAAYDPNPPTDVEPGFFSKVGDAAAKRAGNVDSWKAPVVVGQAAGFVNDVAGAGIESIYGMLPQEARDKISGIIKDAMDTDTGRAVKGTVQKGTDKYEEFKSGNPELAKELEGVANMAGVMPVSKIAGMGVNVAKDATKATVKEGVNVVKDVGRILVPPVQGALDQELKGIVIAGVNKGIRPTVVGKDTAPRVAQYYDKATDAVKNIVENKPNLQIIDAAGEVSSKLPSTLNEFSQAVDQTKKSIFIKYDSMQKAAGQANATVDLSGVIKELDTIATNKVMLAEAPDVARYAYSKARALEQAGSYTTEEAQQAIQMANAKLEAFYKNPSYDAATKAKVDALVANNMRTGLDDVIEQAVGSGYQDLKNQYGSLKAIEKEVNQRAIVDARKSVKGMIDHYSVFTGYEAIRGILAMEPAVVAAATSARGIAEWLKWRNNPNRAINEMFQGAERNLTKQELLRQGNPAQSWSMQQLGY
jgi:hypothetical protein